MFDRNVIEAERGFFGVTKVALDEQLGYRFMINGRTVHGIQRLAGKQTEPLSYYHPTGPIGDVFRVVAQDSKAKVGVIGLGTGSIASYAKAGQRFDFFEIDPIVTEFASNPKFFTFLSQSAGKCKVIQGDARIQLQKLSEQESRVARYDFRQVAHTSDANHEDKDLRYDLLILDAFSSDSIPSHLITREALQLYRERTRKDGVIAMHISNNFIDLEPLVALLAADANMPALIRIDPCSEAITHENAKTSSIYVVMSDNQLLMQQFANLPNWRELNKREGVKLWTDDYSCMLEIIRWSH